MSTPAIQTLHAVLRAQGLDLGAAQGDEQDAGFGGRYQAYEHGRIYWHASTGAHALRGRLLQRYLGAGGPGPNPATNERELGFPTSSHMRTDDGRFECATFEWGTIADVSGTPLVRLFGELHEAWKREGGALGRLGHPIDDVARLDGGRVAWFERGALWHAEGSTDVLVAELIPPTLGQPALVNPENPGTFEWVRFDGALPQLDAHPTLAAALFRGRFSLVPAGGGTAIDLVPAAAPHARDGARWLGLNVAGSTAGTPVRRSRTPMVNRGDTHLGTQSAPRLTRRQLYSLAFRTPGMAPRVVSPHCLYARSDWENFGLAHITDIHVSRRIEHYRSLLRARGVAEEDVARLNNWNDAFRGFIRYANHLHAAGLLDVIIATGDLVDYVREIDDHPQGPGNFGFFEALVQGLAPGLDPESQPAEALRVPIFTSLGNHDYRGLPYTLGMKLSVRTSDVLSVIPLVGGLLRDGVDAATEALSSVPGLGAIAKLDVVELLSSLADVMWNHAGLNTTNDEALRLMGMTPDGTTYYVPALRPEGAAKAVRIDPAMRNRSHYYFRRINPSDSYVVPLGAHRVVMLDTRWDDGITDDVSEAALTKLGFGSEGQENFQSGSPDSVGIQPRELDVVRGALAEAGDAGVVIVGMHAPPLNPAGTDLANCLRESVHPTNDQNQVLGWLARHDPLVMLGNPRKPGGNPDQHPGWVRTGTPHFHEGPIEDLLDEGIAIGEQEALAKLLAGDGNLRPVTLLCCGHGHYRIEYRLRWDAASQQLLTYTDHYLANPATYYKSALVEGDWTMGESHRRYLVRVTPGASPAGDVVKITDHETIWTDRSELRVPPYPTPLSDAPDPAAWWRAHAPVVVQTAALGPCTNSRAAVAMNKTVPQPNFQGFRVITIASNVIARVQYVSMPEVLTSAFPLAWESGGTAHPPVTPPVTPPPAGTPVVTEWVRDGVVVRDHRR